MDNKVYPSSLSSTLLIDIVFVNWIFRSVIVQVLLKDFLLGDKLTPETSFCTKRNSPCQLSQLRTAWLLMMGWVLSKVRRSDYLKLIVRSKLEVTETMRFLYVSPANRDTYPETLPRERPSRCALPPCGALLLSKTTVPFAFKGTLCLLE
jgi:hypothetical protein